MSPTITTFSTGPVSGVARPMIAEIVTSASTSVRSTRVSRMTVTTPRPYAGPGAA